MFLYQTHKLHVVTADIHLAVVITREKESIPKGNSHFVRLRLSYVLIMEVQVFLRRRPRALVIKSPDNISNLCLFLERSTNSNSQSICTAQFVSSESIKWNEFSPLLGNPVYGCVGLIQIESGSCLFNLCNLIFQRYSSVSSLEYSQ